VADGQYAITSDGIVKATVSRQVADHVRRAQSISVDNSDEDDTAVLLAMMLAIEAVQYERGGARFSPRALLDLLNPLNWLWLWWSKRTQQQPEAVRRHARAGGGQEIPAAVWPDSVAQHRPGAPPRQP
jgi:hypothetical protein